LSPQPLSEHREVVVVEQTLLLANHPEASQQLPLHHQGLLFLFVPVFLLLRLVRSVWLVRFVLVVQFIQLAPALRFIMHFPLVREELSNNKANSRDRPPP
jgi:hypothetical protein